MNANGPSHVKKELAQRSVGQLVNPRLDVFEHAQQDHVVDTGPDENDREALVHARFGDGHRGLANLLGLAKQNALRAGLASIKGVGLRDARVSF